MRKTRGLKLCLTLGMFACISTGCVRRRMTVRTNPSGAMVYIDKQPIGRSPISASTTYYATREIEAVRDGYRTEKIFRTFSPPWYQIPPLDFITETLWPWEIRDDRVVDITLVPEQTLPREVLQARAEELRLQASQGIATPLPPTAQVGPDFRSGVAPVPARPIDPTFVPDFNPSAPPLNQPAPGFQAPPRPPWRPGQIIGGFLAPDGSPPQRIPETGILPGGGYRPELPQ